MDGARRCATVAGGRCWLLYGSVGCGERRLKRRFGRTRARLLGSASREAWLSEMPGSAAARREVGAARCGRAAAAEAGWSSLGALGGAPSSCASGCGCRRLKSQFRSWFVTPIALGKSCLQYSHVKSIGSTWRLTQADAKKLVLHKALSQFRS